MATAFTTAYSEQEDQFIRDNYLAMTHKEIGDILGRPEKGIRNRAWRLRLRKYGPPFSDDERGRIRAAYEQWGSGRAFLIELAEELGRNKSDVSTIAKSMGLTRYSRQVAPRVNGLRPCDIKALPMFATKEERSAHTSIRVKKWIAEHGHPRGALGMKHTPEAKAIISRNSKEMNARMTPEQKREVVMKRRETNLERYGTFAPGAMLRSNPYSRTKSGKRADLGDRFFRSSWEANYARYLNWLKDRKEILDWEYEPQLFVFAGVTRGPISYTPDFKVFETDGSYRWHEVKGWMDSKSKSKLRRMAKFYPEETVIIIGSVEYYALKKWSGLIAEWE